MPESAPRLKNKVAVITGAGRGIGAAIAARFAGEGARVAILDCAADEAKSVADSIGASSGTARVYACDIRSEEQVEAAMQAIADEWAGLDVLVNNAAVFPERVPFTEVSFEQWKEVIDVNLFGSYRCSQAAARHMIARQMPGRIVNISSLNALRYRRGTYGQTQYNVSKAALDNLTKGLAMELAPYGIVVNGIAPGFVRTRLSLADPLDDSEFRREYLDSGRIPLQRYGTPDDCARLALFLSSDECTWITGETIHQDGGMHFTF
jgi:3-oxoacyl-[acyl-carrier protein] reductase